MFEDFVEVDLGFNSIICKPFKLYKKYIIIDNDIREIKIYTGVWIARSWSVPEYKSSLNDYTHLGLALIRSNCRLLTFQDLKVSSSLKNTLSSYIQEYNYCSFTIEYIALFHLLFHIYLKETLYKNISQSYLFIHLYNNPQNNAKYAKKRTMLAFVWKNPIANPGDTNGSLTVNLPLSF